MTLLAIVALASLCYWLLWRRARDDEPPLLRVAPAAWLEVVHALFSIPLWLGAVVPVLAVPFLPDLALSDVAVTSLTLLTATVGLRIVLRSGEVVITRKGIGLFCFHLAWREVEEVIVEERSVRFRAPARNRGLRGVEIPISDLGWAITPEVGEQLRLLHWWMGPAREEAAPLELLVA